MKKFISILLAGLLLTSLTACGGKTTNTDNTVSEGAAKKTDAVIHYADGTDAWVDSVDTSAADYDFSENDATTVYSMYGETQNNYDKFVDKTIALMGIFQTSYYEAADTTYYYLTGMDYVNNCCNWNFELKFNDATPIPETASGVVLFGTFGSYIDDYDQQSYNCLFVEQIANSEEAEKASDISYLSADTYIPEGDTVIGENKTYLTASTGAFGKGTNAVTTALDMTVAEYNYSSIENQYMVSNALNLMQYPGNFYKRVMCFKGTLSTEDGRHYINNSDDDGSNAWKMELFFNDATTIPDDGTLVQLIGTFSACVENDNIYIYGIGVDQITLG